jgi:SAM-dependent methyltransferase
VKDDYYLDPRVAGRYDTEQQGREVTEDDIPFYIELARGTGRVTIPVAQAGADVVGLDRSPAMLAVARRKSQGIDNIRWIEGDMSDFDLGQRFGLVMVPFRSFLLLLTVAEQKSCLRAIRAHLVDGGRLALNIFNPDLVSMASWIGESHETWWRSEEKQARRETWVRRRYRTAGQELHETRAEIDLAGGGAIIARVERNLRLRYVFRYEMEHLLELNGFEVESLFGWFDRRPFEDDSSEMVWVARKCSATSG